MPFGVKFCKQCNKEMTIKIKRDLTRKNFCSHSCRQIWYQANDERYKINQKINSIRFKTIGRYNDKKGLPGERNPRYLKDRSALKHRNRYELSEWRKAVFVRDSFTCVMCLQKGGKLNADHIKPYCAFPELRYDINNGRTLCISCHKKTDTYGSKAWKYKKSEMKNV